MNHPPFSRAAACAAVAVALAACGSVAAAHGNDDRAAAKKPFDAARVEDTAFGREGDPRKVGRIVRLGMSDALRYTPSSITVRRGETVRFIVHNEGKLLHEMILGTPQDLQAHAELMRKFPGMEHADANMTHVKPGTDGEIVWQFTRAGTFQFACLVPGHFEAGMVGKVTVR